MFGQTCPVRKNRGFDFSVMKMAGRTAYPSGAMYGVVTLLTIRYPPGYRRSARHRHQGQTPKSYRCGRFGFLPGRTPICS
jgi:hypothetical protein